MTTPHGHNIGYTSGMPRRYFSVVLVLCLGLILTLVSAQIVRGWEAERAEADFSRFAQGYAHRLQEALKLNLALMQSIRSFYTTSAHVSRDEFTNFVRGHRPHDALMLTWVPRVRGTERETFEAIARSEVQSEFFIHDINAFARSIPAASRDEYYPIYYIEPPLSSWMDSLGFDLARVPQRWEAMQRARDAERQTATGRLRLPHESGEEYGYLVFEPIFSNALPHGTVEERRQHLRGFVFGVFRFSTTVKAAIGSTADEYVELRLHDESADQQHRLLYAHPVLSGARDMLGFENATARRRPALEYSSTFVFAGRTWSVVCRPTAAYLAERRAWNAWLVLVLGVILTMVLSIHLWSLANRAETVQQLVERRTEELSTANQSLEREIADRKQAEQALMRSEDRFRKIFEEGAMAMALVREDGRFIKVNPMLCQLVGYSSNELMSMKTDNITHPDDQEQDRASAAQVFKGDIPTYQVEQRLIRKDGRVLWVQLTGSVVWDNIGQPEHGLIMMADISERKLADDALRSSEERTRLIIETANDAFIEIDDNGVIMAWNAEAERLFGWSREEVVGQLLQQTIMPEEFRQEYKNDVLQFLRGGGEPCLNKPQELKTLRRDGRKFPVEVTIWPVHVGGRSSFSAFVRDISARKEMEGALQEQLIELKKFKDVIVGREHRMIQLKKEINHLHRELGRPVRYEDARGN